MSDFTRRSPLAKIAKVVDEFTISEQGASLSETRSYLPSARTEDSTAETVAFDNVELLLELNGTSASLPGLSLGFKPDGLRITSVDIGHSAILPWEAVRRIVVGRRRFYRSSQVYHLLEISTDARSYSFVIPRDRLVNGFDHMVSLASQHKVEVIGKSPGSSSKSYRSHAPRPKNHRSNSLPFGGMTSSTLRSTSASSHNSMSRRIKRMVRESNYLLAASPRHGLSPRQRFLSVGIALLALVLVASGTSGFQRATGRMEVKKHTVSNPRQLSSLSSAHLAEVIHHPPLEPGYSIFLPPATSTPAPLPPSLAKSQALSPHEIFGFAPYWTLPYSSGFDLNALTTISYFGVDVAGNGSLIKTGNGWNGYESADLASLITRAHRAGVRVVLTVKSFSQTTLDQLTHDPGAATTLAVSLERAITAKEMDGVNFDLEGEGPADRGGLVRLIAKVSTMLRGLDPYWQITMDTYGSSAVDSTGFFDIKALAPYVNAFFVMAYDMGSMSTPSPTAPLSGYDPSDLSVIDGYLGVVPASKVILGVPFYGYEWPTNGGYFGAAASGAPTPLTYAQIANSSWPVYWDTTSSTPWTSFQVAGQWYEVYYDDPTSLALKADLANFFSLRGVGIWALGMAGNDPAMMAALLGRATPLKDLHIGEPPTAAIVSSGGGASGAGTAGTAGTSPSNSKPPSYWYRAEFDGDEVQLVPVALQSILASGSWGVIRYAGRLSSFSTNNPSYACLSSSPTLDVWKDSYSQNIYVVDNKLQPGQCAVGVWKMVFTSSPSVSAPTPPSTPSGSTTFPLGSPSPSPEGSSKSSSGSTTFPLGS